MAERNVLDFGAVGDGVTDDTAAIQSAVNSGSSLYFPKGIYLTKKITIPVSAAGATYRGDGFYHYDATKQTVIKAAENNQDAVFQLASGVSNITFAMLRIEGDNKAQIGIDGTYGPFLTLNTVGVYNCTSYGVYSKQGVCRFDRCFFGGSDVGLHLYADSAVTDSEFTGGSIPLKLVAGGNRICNIWANTGTQCCIHLEPFDASTPHFNTSIVNLYAGEVHGGSVSKPIINIKGLSNNRIKQVQISNSFLVSAEAISEKINGGILLDYVDDVVISNVIHLGNSSATSTRYTDYFIKATNSTYVSITGTTMKYINKNPVQVGTGCYAVNLTGCQFIDWCTSQPASPAAAVYVTASVPVTVTGCCFDIANSDTVPYAADVTNATYLLFEGNILRYANTNVAICASGSSTGSYRRVSEDPILRAGTIQSGTISNDVVNRAKQNYYTRGQASTPSGGGTTDLFTLPSSSDNKSYLVFVQQSGSGANGAVGAIFAFGSYLGAATMANSNSAASLQISLNVSGNTVRMTAGTGYGLTTWDWQYIRIG